MVINVPGIFESVFATLAGTAIIGLYGLSMKVTAIERDRKSDSARLERIETKLDNMLERCFQFHAGR